jgi:hypothetical protein
MRYLTPPNLSVLVSQNSIKPATAHPVTVTHTVTQDTYDNYVSPLQATNDGVCDTKTDKMAFFGVGVKTTVQDENVEWF